MPIYVGYNFIALPTIGFMIFSLSNSKGLIASLLSNSLFVWLGKISYCFYSFQALIILLLIQYHDSIVQYMPALANNLILMGFAFVTLLLLFIAGYYFIEEPMRKWIRNFERSRISS